MKFKKINDDALLPQRQTPGAAGYDLHALEVVAISQGAVTEVRTGVAVQIPAGHVGLIRDRSGLARKNGVHVLAGVIDADYTGELIVLLTSASNGAHVTPGDRIAQLVVVPCVMEKSEWVTDLEVTDRGAKGFGSTGHG